LGHEVNELTSSKLLKLEMENQSLTKTVEELRSTADSAAGSTSKILKVEKENQRLNKKVNANLIFVVMLIYINNLYFSFVMYS
jgi:hypothetical protein